jgi:Protein of unknown function (DUF998)
LAPAYLAYNALVVGFAGTLYLASPRTGAWKIGAALSAINAFAGVVMVTLFREDLGGMPTTAAGVGHLAFAGVSSLAIVAAAVIYGIAFRRAQAWRPLAIFSFGTAVGFGVLGPLAAIATAQGSALAGLAERGPIGLFLLWLLVVGSYALVISSRPQVTTRAR